MNRKGQSSIEYMSTYVYASVALLLVVGAMAYFGAFNPDTYARESCESGQQLKCADAIITEEGNILVSITNNFDRPVTITNYIITYDNQNYSGILDTNITPQNNITLLAETNLDLPKGKKVRVNYQFSYQSLDALQTYVNSGQATTRVEERITTTCGNNKLEGIERCEPPGELVDVSCERVYTRENIPYNPSTQRVTGEILCDATCQIDFSDCVIETIDRFCEFNETTGATQLISNGFEGAYGSYIFLTDTTSTVERVEDAAQGSISIQINLTDDDAGSTFFRNSSFNYQVNNTYAIQFWAKASSENHMVNVAIMQSDEPNTHYDEERVTLTQEWQEYFIKLTPHQNDPSGRLTFYVNDNDEANTVWLDHIRIYEYGEICSS